MKKQTIINVTLHNEFGISSAAVQRDLYPSEFEAKETAKQLAVEAFDREFGSIPAPDCTLIIVQLFETWDAYGNEVIYRNGQFAEKKPLDIAADTIL